MSAEDMDELPEGIRESIVSYVRKVSYEHRGPLPAPQTLREYEQILPGVADRIVSQAERQSAHRMELERTVVTSEGRRSWAGWASATLIGVGVLVAAVVVTLEGYPWAGVAFVGSDIAGLAALFVVGGRRQEDAETKERLTEILSGE